MTPASCGTAAQLRANWPQHASISHDGRVAALKSNQKKCDFDDVLCGQLRQLRPPFLASTHCSFLGSPKKDRLIPLLENRHEAAPQKYSLCVSPNTLGRPASLVKASVGYRATKSYGLLRQAQETFTRRRVFPGTNNFGCPPFGRRPPCAPPAGRALGALNVRGEDVESKPEGADEASHDSKTIEGDSENQAPGEESNGAPEEGRTGSVGTSGREESEQPRRKARGRRSGARGSVSEDETSDEDADVEGGPSGRKPGPRSERKRPSGYRNGLANARMAPAKKSRRKEKVPSLFRVEEELSRGRGRGPRGGQAAAKNTPRSEDSNPPGESSDSEDGDSAGVPETRGWPIPEATRERADKDKQLRVAVEKILLYWGKEENKERGMSDELMDFMVELLDKYNAYVHCEYEAPWGAAIERFIEAINDLDGIDQHLDEFVEEVYAFDMAALREARQAQWAADVEQARKEGKLSARQAALDIQPASIPDPVTGRPMWEAEALQFLDENSIPDKNSARWQEYRAWIDMQWMEAFEMIMTFWRELDLDAGELARVEAATRGTIRYVSDVYRIPLPSALIALERMCYAYELRDSEALAKANDDLLNIPRYDEYEDEAQLFLGTVGGLHSYLALRMGVETPSPPRQEEPPPEVKPAVAGGISGLLASGAKMVKGVVGRFFGSKDFEALPEQEKEKLIAELSGEESDEGDGEGGEEEETPKQLVGRFTLAFRARRKAPGEGENEELDRDIQEKEGAESQSKDERGQLVRNMEWIDEKIAQLQKENRQIDRVEELQGRELEMSPEEIERAKEELQQTRVEMHTVLADTVVKSLQSSFREEVNEETGETESVKVVSDETVEAVRVLLERWVAFDGQINDGVGVDESAFQIICNLGAALKSRGVKAIDVAVTDLQRLILEGKLADDRALDAAVTILEDVVSNVIPGIVSSAEDEFDSFANELFTIWVKGIRQADYLDLLKRARNFVEGIVESSGRNPSRALKERLYNILVNRCSAEGKKRHRELGAQFRDGLSLLWGSEGYAPLNVKEIEKRMEEVRERAQEHGAVDVELADREEGSPDGARVWVSDLTAGLEAVSEEELLVGSWEEWLEEGEGVVMVLREDAGAVMDWYGDQLPEEVRGVLEEELEKRGKDITDAEDAKVAAKKREKQGARGKTPGASAPIGKLVQELEEAHDGLSRKGGAVDRAMEAPWESMKEMWGYPYMEEPWLVDMSRSLEYHGPVAGTIFIGIIQEVLPARGGALVVLEAGNNAPPPVVLDYGFESVPMRFHGKWNKFEKELAKKAPWKAKKGGADGSDSADGSNGADGSFGADGSSGADGSNGADASSGADGSSGADCSNGADASDGADASNGANGTNGSAGLNDVDGSNGVDVSNAAEQVSEAEHGKDGSVAEGEGQNGKENEGENGKAEEENLVSSAVRELERVIEAANSDPTEPSEESVKELLRATIGLYFADSASNTVLDATSDVTRSEGEPSGTKEGASESSSGTPDVTSEASETEGPSGSTTGGMETAGATTGLIEAEGASSTGRGESKSEEASVSASEASGPTVGASETPADASDSEGDASKSAADASDSPAEASDPAAQTSESTAEASGASADTSEAEHETEHTDRQPGSHGPVIYQRHEFLFSKLSGQKCSSELRDTIWAKTKRGQYVLVQVRGPSASGRTWEDGHPMPEVSTTIEISGNHLVFRPGRNDILEVDPSIAGSERNRLLLFVALNAVPGCGISVHASAEGVSDVLLRRELQELDREWQTIKNRCYQKAYHRAGPQQVFHPEVYAGKMARQMARLAQQDAVQARVAEQRRREALRQAEFREELEREGKVAKDAPIPVELAKLKGMKKEKKEGEQGGEEGVATEKKGEEAAIERKPKAADTGPKVRREIIINAARTSMPRVAILEDGRLAEMLLEQEKQVSVGDVLLAQVTAKVRAMAGLFVDVTVYKKAFLQAYNHHRPYVFRRLPNGSVEAVGGWDEDSADGTDSGDGMDEADAGSGSAEGVGRNGTGRNGRERKEAEAGVSDEEDDVGDDGEDDVMAEDGEEEEELQLGDEGEIGDAEGKEDGGKDGHAALRQSGWTTSRNWQDVEVGDLVVVKCTKESYGSKGPKVSAVLSHPGRFVVLTARSDGVHISAKIRSPDERKRLETLGKLLKPAGYRLLLRTESQGAQGKEIQQDIYQVQTVIEGILRKAEEAVKRNTGALLLYKAMTPTQAIVRDLMSTEVERLVVDTPEVHAQVMSYLAENNSEHLMNRVELYSGKQGVMDAFGVEGQINSIFQSRVQLDSGAYLVIQKTEALWSIDVNGGRAVTSGKRARAEAQSETHLRINLEAARQVAKELRARDLSGIVVVDFIDMASPAMNAQVEKAMWEALQADRARVKMGKINEPGNCMQILRSRLRDNLANLLTAPCPLCTHDFHSVSAGRIPSREAVVAEIERTVVRKEADGSIPRTPNCAERPESNGRNPTWPTLFLTVHERVEQFFLGNNLKRLNTTMAALRVNINVMVPDTPIREYDFQIQLSGRSEPLHDSAKERKESAERVSQKAWGGGQKLAHSPEAHVIDVTPEEDDVSTARRGATSKRRGVGEADGAEEGGARRGYVYRKWDDVSERRRDDVSERRAEDGVGERRRADVSERRRESVAETRREKGIERRVGDVSERRRDDVSERRREDPSVQKKDTVSVHKKDNVSEGKKDAVSERPTVRASFTDGGGFESGEEDRKERRRKVAERIRKEQESSKAAERLAENAPQSSPLAELLVSQERQPAIWSKVGPTKGPVKTQAVETKQKESGNGVGTGPQTKAAENGVRGEVKSEALSGKSQTASEVRKAGSQGQEAELQGPSESSSDKGGLDEAVSSAQNGALLSGLDTTKGTDAGAVEPDEVIQEGSNADGSWGADGSGMAGTDAAESMTSGLEAPEESLNGADVSNGARADVGIDADLSDVEGRAAGQPTAGPRRGRRGKKAARGEGRPPADSRAQERAEPEAGTSKRNGNGTDGTLERTEPEAGTPERGETEVGTRARSDLALMMESAQFYHKVTKLSPDKAAKMDSVGSTIMTVLAQQNISGAGEPWNFMRWLSGERSGTPPERAARYEAVLPLLHGAVERSVDDEEMSELQEALLEIPDNESGDFLSNELPALPPEFLPMMGLADWSGAEGARDGALGDVTQAVYDISSEEGRNGRAEGPSNGGEESDDDVAPPVVQTSSVMTRPVVRPVPVRPGPKAGPGNPSARPKRKSRQKKR